MRAKVSENSFLPLYTSLSERHYAIYDNDIPVISFTDFASIKLQYPFGNTDFTLLGATVKSKEGTHVPTSFGNTKISEDVNNDGNDEYFLEIDGFTFDTPPTVGRYYILFTITIGADTIDYYTEDFFICPPKYKLTYWNSCDDEHLGYFTDDFKHILPLYDLHVLDTDKDETESTRSNGYGGERKIASSTTTVYQGEILGANFLRNSLNFIKNYDNIQLELLETNEIWDISNLVAENSSNTRAFALSIKYETQRIDVLNCIVPAFENAPYTEVGEPSGDLTCGLFAVSLNITGNTVEYTITNDPDVTVTEEVTWTYNGAFYGSGSSISMGGFGTYAIRVKKQNCIAVNSYVYGDPCQVMTSTFTVNNGVINGATNNAPLSVSYEIYDPSGSLVSTSLPYTALTTGAYTVKAISSTCQTIHTVPVRLETPVDCSFTFDITKDGNNLLSIANNTATSYSVEWFAVYSSNIETSVGTGDTYQILKSGLYIARMTSSGCTKDVYFYFEESSSSYGGKYSDYQEFINHTGQNLDITAFTLPHPLINTESEINEQLQVSVEGQIYQYKDTTTDIRDYTIDFANNRIEFHFAAIADVDIQILRRYV